MTISGRIRGRAEQNPEVGVATVLDEVRYAWRDLDRFAGPCQQRPLSRSDRQLAG